MTNEQINYFGAIAIVGRPNVGKSTLLNAILGKKISITSNKPQTTQHRILGIKTNDHVQMVFMDTPGMHTKTPRLINRLMNKTAKAALEDIDAVVFVIEALKFTIEDQKVLDLLSTFHVPCFLVINKVDLLKNKALLLPFLEDMSRKHNFSAIVPLSATKKMQVEALEHILAKAMPVSEHGYDKKQITDKNESFLAEERIREKMVRLVGDELPYAIQIELKKIEKKEKIWVIEAIIWVERESQKKIIIGKEGEKLKSIGTLARKDLETLFDRKIYLDLWVRVRKKPQDLQSLSKNLGLDELDEP